MTEITRSIEINAPKEKVWAAIHPSNWSKIFDYIKKIEGYEVADLGVGTQAQFVASIDENPTIDYYVEITEFDELEKIAYRRFGGPLSGRGVIELRTMNDATRLRRTNYYDDNLTDQTIKSISEGMQTDNARIKRQVESS